MFAWKNQALIALTLLALASITPVVSAGHRGGGGYYRPYYGGYYRPYYGGFYAYPAVGIVIVPRPVVIVPAPVVVGSSPVIVTASPPAPTDLIPVPAIPPSQLRIAPVPEPATPPVP